MTKNFKGYSLVEKRDLPDIRSVGYLYKHDKTGAKKEDKGLLLT